METAEIDYVRDLIAIAPEVYGRYWKTDMCRHLGYTKKTLINWLHGVNAPPRALLLLLSLYALLDMKYDRTKNLVASQKKVRKNA